MRKIKLQMQMSVDGFVGGPSGELSFAVWNWDPALIDYVGKLTDPVTTILLGRKMAEGFMQHWAGVAANESDPMHASGVKFHETEKIIFSRTISSTDGNNATICNDLSRASMDSLKAQGSGDIMVYGGADFVSDCIRQDLIDEYHLFVNPAAIGNGLTIFGRVDGNRSLQLVDSKPFDCGIVVLVYQPVAR